MFHSQFIRREENMLLVNYTIPLPTPTLGAMMATLGELTEFRVFFKGNKGSVTLMYEDTKKRRQRRKTRAPGAAQNR